MIIMIIMIIMTPPSHRVSLKSYLEVSHLDTLAQLSVDFSLKYSLNTRSLHSSFTLFRLL